MKGILAIFLVAVGTLVGLFTVLQNGSLRRYLDAHPEKTWVAPADYYLGEGYYIIGNLEESATYYQRITDRYPKSKYADEAFFGYLQALDDMNLPRQEMVDRYQVYLDRYPAGAHAEMVTHRIENYKNMHR